MSYNKPAIDAVRAAIKRLIAAHADEYAEFVGEERTSRGLSANPGRGTRPTVPMPDLARRIRPEVIRTALGVSGSAWRSWMKRGSIPADRADELAAAIGVPAAMLWPKAPTPKPTPPPAQAQAPRPRTVDVITASQPPGPVKPEYRCVCGETFGGRGDLARHRTYCEDAA